jgi:tRNA/rRNA methyltransferase
VLASAQEYKSVADAVADCTLVVGTTAGRNRELQQPLRRLEEGATLIRQQLGSGRVALLFGSEKRGLSNDDLSHCHWVLRIPTREQHPSMNLGQAVAVCLYELVRAAKRGKREKIERATAEQVERITAMLVETLRASEYPNIREVQVRRLVRHLDMQAADAEAWMGMLRQILWKLRSGIG